VNAFDRTLHDGCDTVFVLNHAGLPLARTKAGTLRLAAVKDRYSSPVPGISGLYAEATCDPSSELVRTMLSAVERGDLDSASFQFRVTRQRWNEPDFTRRWIQEVSLAQGDVSLVTWPANEGTAGTVSLRQRLPGHGSIDAVPSRRLTRGEFVPLLAPDTTIENRLRFRRKGAKTTAPPVPDSLHQRIAQLNALDRERLGALKKKVKANP
jgi:hypothetical protein